MTNRADRKTNNIGKKIVEGLYVGSEEAAKNEDWLKTENIKCILNITHNVPFYFADGGETFEYRRIQIEDAVSADLYQHLKDAVQWIHDRINATSQRYHTRTIIIVNIQLLLAMYFVGLKTSLFGLFIILSSRWCDTLV